MFWSVFGDKSKLSTTTNLNKPTMLDLRFDVYFVLLMLKTFINKLQDHVTYELFQISSI